MQYSKYFKAGQKIFLRSLNPASSGRLDSLTTYVQEMGEDHFDLLLPYNSTESESYPFSPDMPFEILSDAFGMGVKLTGRFQKELEKNTVRLKVEGDLQVFRRRLHSRVDIQAGLRYTKGKGTMRSFREQWEKNQRILQGGGDAKLLRFPRTQVNLSAGGIRFNIKAPVEVADLCLILLELGGPPVCAMTEVIWTRDQESEGRQTAGMRFIMLLESDQARIETYIRKQAAQEKSENESS